MPRTAPSCCAPVSPAAADATGEYCFRLGNGDCGGDAALVVAWLQRKGHERVAVLSEVSPNGEEYFRFFRQECRRRGVSIAAVETVSQKPVDLAANLANLRRVEPDALVYMGYGVLASSTTGGRQTHIACSPHEHGMFRGDWILYGRVTNGQLEFEGLFEQWE